jgi:AAA15 family ATPase/GTPase
MKESPGTERLEVTNFLVLKDVKFDVKRFTVVMGEQATGKSLLAKLLYFFRSGLQDFYKKTICGESLARSSDACLKKLKNDLNDRFCELFPAACWKDTSFSIVYYYDRDRKPLISLKKTRKRALKIEIAPVLNDFTGEWVTRPNEIDEWMTRLDQAKAAIAEDKITKASLANAQRLLHIRYPESWSERIRKDFDLIEEFNLGVLFKDSLFVPASRSFFALLQENIFTFLVGNIEIDPLMAKFGEMYARIKRRRQIMHPAQPFSSLLAEAQSIMRDVISGDYAYEDEKDWIVMKHGKINLANASSGQQESLPMLLTLLVQAFSKPGRTDYFIEEPEAHLFPNSQRQVMLLLAMIYNASNENSFFLTTHSPYILSALDNLIMASNVTRERQETAAKVAAIIPKECHVRYEDVGAYTLENGTLVSTMDEESRLINGDVIDNVSEKFSAEFDALLTLRHGK